MTASRDDSIGAAGVIGEFLLNQAMPAPDQSPTWGRGVDLANNPALNVGIFSGRTGEALFLAALYACTADRRFHDTAREVFASICGAIPDRETARQLIDRVGLGLTGGGSLIYALMRASEWLEGPELLQTARLLASAITEEVAAADRKLDVMWGSAGAIPALLLLADDTEADATRSAVWCAEQILRNRIVDEGTGRYAWGPSLEIPHTGFAHGTTGIACALLRLYQRVPDSRYRDAAFNGFHFERSLYVAPVNDWLDWRDQASPRFVSSWCHGAAGIGLSRVAALNVAPDDERQAVLLDLERAVTKVSSGGLPGYSTLCCGSMGRVDLVLSAGLVLHRDDLVARARRMATGAVNALNTRGYRPVNGTDERTPFGPGMWQGAAGIGYTLLRTWDPARLPSVATLS